MKEENNKRTEESNVDIVEDEKKRENRPKISQQKQYIVLQEQGFKCRGPDKNDNKYYECEMNVNQKRFCGKKSSQPQFDHISRWKEAFKECCRRTAKGKESLQPDICQYTDY